MRLADDDLRYEGADVTLPEIGWRFLKEAFEARRGNLGLIDGDRLQRFSCLRLLRFNQAHEVGALGLRFLHLFFEEVGLLDGSFCKGVEQVANALVDLGELTAKLVEGVGGIAVLRFPLFGDGRDDRLRPLRRQEALREGVERQPVKLSLRNGDGEIAGAFPVEVLAGAFVIAIGPALAGCHHQGLAATLADGEACQQDVAG